MSKTLITSKTFIIGAIYRKKVMVRLDELGIPYVEHRNLVESTIVVQLFTKEDIAAYNIFVPEMKAFIARVRALEQEEEDEREFKELEQFLKKKNTKLARKSRWRRVTFRKPLTSIEKRDM